MSSILKTGDLIRSIKRRAFIPSSQETFSDEDFLEMATEEINLGLVPLIQRMNEEHLVYYIDVEIEKGKRRYPIPARAHGNKLRDVALLDENKNIFEMHRYSISEISDFTNSTVYINSRGFYLENNYVVLANFEENLGQQLRFYFYLRPNILVKEEDGAKIQTITTILEENFINPKAGSISNIQPNGLDTIITSNNHGLKSGSKIQISASNSIPAINGIYEVFNITTNSFSIRTSITTAGNAGSWKLMLEVYQFQFLDIPDKFLNNSKFDFTQKESPNKIIAYDLFVNRIDQNVKVMTFPKDSLEEISIGDYITIQEETIVPNIPTELHPILAQRVAVACLEAMGDEQNKQSAERKLAAMEKDAGTFLDNRVEGASQKIKARHSPLVNTLNTLGRRNRRW
jgi:hypothetical protein